RDAVRGRVPGHVGPDARDRRGDSETTEASALSDLLGLLAQLLEILAKPIVKHQRIRPLEAPPRESDGHPPVQATELPAAFGAGPGKTRSHGLDLIAENTAASAPILVNQHLPRPKPD